LVVEIYIKSDDIRGSGKILFYWRAGTESFLASHFEITPIELKSKACRR
jgi:hypothetical protein